MLATHSVNPSRVGVLVYYLLRRARLIVEFFDTINWICTASFDLKVFIRDLP